MPPQFTHGECSIILASDASARHIAFDTHKHYALTASISRNGKVFFRPRQPPTANSRAGLPTIPPFQITSSLKPSERFSDWFQAVEK